MNNLTDLLLSMPILARLTYQVAFQKEKIQAFLVGNALIHIHLRGH